jgi:hypothetical protein
MKVTPYVVTKKTVFKWQEGFWKVWSQKKKKFQKQKTYHKDCSQMAEGLLEGFSYFFFPIYVYVCMYVCIFLYDMYMYIHQAMRTVVD